MGMGAPFDPMRKHVLELRKRAIKFSVIYGKTGHSDYAGATVFAEEGDVSVFVSSRRFEVRTYMPDHLDYGSIQPWSAVYSEEDDEERRNDRLVMIALDRLREMQILDDLADV